ncbi:MAG: leucine-rich repeat domain-containing protein [Myxococcota bacterium]
MAKARKLLKRHGSDDVKAALANRSAMAYSGSKAEAHTTGSLGSYATQAPELDWIWMARELYKRYGHGLRYVLQNADHATRLEVLRGQIDRGSLNFHSVWSPRSRPYYENVYAYYTGIAVPSYLYELTELTELNLSWCHFDSLPPGLSALAKLRKLDLSGNMLTALPDELWTLTELRELRIGVNQLAAFPKKVTALPNLKLLDLRGNRRRDAKHLYEPLSVPPNVRKAMPHCRFLDGLTPQQQRHMSYHT